ncbi:FAS-associated factor 2-like [Sycon ciliatum]|uniref:FAS-associated factor 2-like n=1 Tax=Sycon ciliatum TaxID=27933 RepID=UPI0031F718CE
MEAEASSGDDHDQLVAQYQAFTGREDMGECRRVLEAHGWNVEMAVQDTFNEQEGKAPVYGHNQHPYAPETAGEPSPPSAIAGIDGQDDMPAQLLRHRRAVADAAAAARSTPLARGMGRGDRHQPLSAPQRPAAGWMQWCWNVVSSPFRLFQSGIWFVARFVYTLLTGAGMLLDVPDPEGDVRKFVEEFGRRYGGPDSPHVPNFMVCSYAQAIRRAKEEVKLLLVYCHDGQNQSTPAICRDVLCSEEVATFVNDNMLVFGVGMESPEGRRVSVTIRNWGQPMLCTLAYRHGNSLVALQRIPLPQLESRGTVLAALTMLVESQRADIAQQRVNLERISQDRLIREQQEREYNESLQRDRERELRLQAQRDAAEQQLAERELRKRNRLERAETLRRSRQQAADSLLAEPAAVDGNVVRLSIRLPDNTRLERRFLGTESLSTVHSFVFSHEEAPAQFTMLTTYPKRELVSTGENVQCIVAAGLAPAAVLVVRDEDVDSSGSEDEADEDEIA